MYADVPEVCRTHCPVPEELEETIPALKALCQHILDPVIDHFGREQFQLTYGFCSKDLKRFLSQKNPETDIKNGRVNPSREAAKLPLARTAHGS